MNQDKQSKRDISQLINTVATVLLSILVIIVGFAIIDRNVETSFIFFAILAALSLALSIFFSGVGLSRLRRDFTGKTSYFNLQAWAVLVGFILIIVTFTQFGELRTEVTNKKLSDLSAAIDSLRIELQEIRSEVRQQDSLPNDSIPDTILNEE